MPNRTKDDEPDSTTLNQSLGLPCPRPFKKLRPAHLSALQDDVEAIELRILAVNAAEGRAGCHRATVGQAPDVERRDRMAGGSAAGDHQPSDGGVRQDGAQ